jgi:hypothetical protein
MKVRITALVEVDPQAHFVKLNNMDTLESLEDIVYNYLYDIDDIEVEYMELEVDNADK